MGIYLAAAAAMYVKQPFRPVKIWLQFPQIYNLLLTAVASLWLGLGFSRDDPRAISAARSIAYIVAVLAIGLIPVVLVSFIGTLMTGAGSDQRVRRARKAAIKRAADEEIRKVVKAKPQVREAVIRDLTKSVTDTSDKRVTLASLWQRLCSHRVAGPVRRPSTRVMHSNPLAARDGPSMIIIIPIPTTNPTPQPVVSASDAQPATANTAPRKVSAKHFAAVQKMHSWRRVAAHYDHNGIGKSSTVVRTENPHTARLSFAAASLHAHKKPDAPNKL